MPPHKQVQRWETGIGKYRKENGLCINCGEPRGVQGTSLRCRPCAEIRLKLVRDLRARRRENHLCARCGQVNDTNMVNCSKCASKINKKDKDFGKTRRFVVFQRVSKKEKPACMNCGCDDMRALELHHKLGGGCQDYKKYRTKEIINALYCGRRKIEDFSVLCKVCNALEYAQRKWKLKWGVVYQSNDAVVLI